MLETSLDSDDEFPDLPYDSDFILGVMGQGHQLNRRLSNQSTDSELSQCDDRQRLLSQHADKTKEANSNDLDLLNIDLNEYVIISVSVKDQGEILKLFRNADVTNIESVLKIGRELDYKFDDVIVANRKQGYIEKMRAAFNRDYVSKQAEVIRKYAEKLQLELEDAEEGCMVKELLEEQR